MKRYYKKYKNRHIYDLYDSSYVELEDIANVVSSGKDIEITESSNNKNITYQVLLEVIFKREKIKLEFNNKELLEKVIRSPSCSFSGYIKELENSELLFRPINISNECVQVVQD